MVLTEEIKDILKKTMHPEVNKSLVDLAMIRDVTIKDSKITVTLVVPFLHVPIKDDLIKIVKDTIKKNKDIEVEVIVNEMNEDEKKIFGTLIKKTRGLEI
jgi:ATP-binding protein involved in chromosome partitioning